MKTLSILSVTVMLACSLSANADSAQAPVLIQLPPLEYFLSAVQANSPAIQAQKLQSAAIKENIAVQKKKWSDYVYVEGATNYGRFDQVSITSLTASSASSTGTVSQNEQVKYYVGLSVKLPLSAGINRGNLIAIQKMELQKSEAELAETESLIRQKIISAYFSLQYMEQSARTFQSIYQTLDISMQAAEQALLNGSIELSQYALLTSTVGKAKDDRDKALSAFYAQYYILREMCGLSAPNNNTVQP